MKSFTQVYNQSKAEVLGQRKALIESQKAAVINVLKEEYMITCKMSELSPQRKEEMAMKLKEYWSPKKGLTNAGVRLLNENKISLSKDSTMEDIKLYITKQTKKNLQQITECFRANCANVVVESFNDEIKAMVGRKLKENFIKNVVWDIVSNRIKNGL